MILKVSNFFLSEGSEVKPHKFTCNFTGTVDDSEVLINGYQTVGCHYEPNAFLMSLLLFIGTFLIAWNLKKFKSQSFFTNGVRSLISDFAVIIAILTMTIVDICAKGYSKSHLFCQKYIVKFM